MESRVSCSQTASGHLDVPDLLIRGSTLQINLYIRMSVLVCLHYRIHLREYAGFAEN